MPQFPYTYIVHTDGSQVFAQNSGTGNDDFQGANAASVLLQAFAESDSVLVKTGEYTITEPLEIPSGMSLTCEPGVLLWVPSGYSQHVLGIGSGVQRVKVSGGWIRERGPTQRRWQGVRMHHEAGDQGIVYNVIEGIEIWDADIAIKLLVDHEDGWINGNIFRDIAMYRANGFIDFDMQSQHIAGHNGFNRNLFIGITCQSEANTQFGINAIRHRANVFLDVKFSDPQNPSNASAFSASVHTSAEDTLLLGGSMTDLNFDDQGARTQILDSFDQRQLFLHRLAVEDGNGDTRINLSGSGGAPSPTSRVHINGEAGNLSLGGNNSDGDVLLRGTGGNTRIHFSAGGGEPSSTSRVSINGRVANLSLGGNDEDGDVLLRGTGGNTRIHFSAGGGEPSSTSRVSINGRVANLSLGGNGEDGDVLLRGTAGNTRIHFSAGGGDSSPTARVHINGANGNLRLGGHGRDGDLAIFPGTATAAEMEDVNNASILLDGAAGDIILRNADCAEEFDVDDTENIEPGSVLVIVSESKLTKCTQAYDKRVAGVVSGAGDYQPGILLDRQHTICRRLPIALMGKVHCKVDARQNSIEVGDLLTTAEMPGHAMKVVDPSKAMGSIIGKALKPLKSGTGLIPVLVTLQ